MLHVQHVLDCPAGGLVKLDPERVLRVALASYGLTKKAENDGIVFGFAGNGAQLTSTTNADQTAVRFKIIDSDDVSPSDPSQPMFTRLVEDDKGNTRIEYRGYQSTKVCLLLTVVEAKEGASMKADCFDDLFLFVKMLEDDDLPANGNGPALKPIKIVGCGDMSFLQKLVEAGGACKVMKFFCLYCAWHGNQVMFYKCYGDDHYQYGHR